MAGSTWLTSNGEVPQHRSPMNRRNTNQVSEANALRYIPESCLTPFGVIGIPMLWCDDPDFDKNQLWIDIKEEFIKLFDDNRNRGKSYRVLWEEAAMQCGAEWSAGYGYTTGRLILNVKLRNVRCTQIFEFSPARYNG